MRQLDIVTPVHQKTKRDFVQRMLDNKVFCMRKAKAYGFEYWDGDRRYGYGGYHYIEGWWKPVAEALVDTYGLTASSRILDVGCGKAYLLYELSRLLPGIKVFGFDISRHGLSHCKEEIRSNLLRCCAQDPYPFRNNSFDLVISLGCIHNLRIYEIETAIREIERIGRNKYLMVESYRNEQELFNLQCWALTAESFFDKDEWIWLYDHFGYTGDYEFIYFV